MSGSIELTPESLLSLHDLCVDYVSPGGIARAVNMVSLDIMQGETIGLAGESGCGKSTLAFAISRLHKMPALISSGEIWFNGQDVLKMNEETLRKFRWSEVSIVFQSAMNSLNPVISIGEQMTDVLLAHQDVSQEQATERAAELLKVVGIHSSRLSSFPHQLSGGMRQRVVIAIALALNPKLIIMDEPTTALDVVVEREIMEELYDLKEQTTITKSEGLKWHLIQTLAGDQTDGYAGVPGIGVKRAVQLFEENGYNWKTVVDAFEAKGLTEEDALTNARLAKILTASDYDFAEGAPLLFTPDADYRVDD